MVAPVGSVSCGIALGAMWRDTFAPVRGCGDRSGLWSV